MTNLLTKTLFIFYEILWIIFIPLLKINKRIREGYNERKLKGFELTRKDIWIQAASAGESYLVETLLKHAPTNKKMDILLTTCTSQGVEILEGIEKKNINSNINLEIRYLPFDRPSLMRKAVKVYKPDVMVVLETEIWPGLFLALKKENIKTIIVNGRITQKSINGYKKLFFLWPKLAPTKILATKELDAKHFKELFHTDTEVMNNIKFERIPYVDKISENELTKILGEKFLVLGSVREEEEESVTYIVKEILKRNPDTTIGLFPRHMHRIEAWQKIFNENSINYILRSEISTPTSSTVILWDKFGELSKAYEIASAVFVGGTLSNLGGQNFLEPVMCGVIPVIGPSWENFYWLGNEIVEDGLVKILPDEKGVAQTLSSDLRNPQPKDTVIKRVGIYLESKKGGSKKVWENIFNLVNL
jgi:3-deoxy-D-manno-octulosonic-acid transferase